MQIADLAAGTLGAVTQVLGALLVRTRTGRGARLVVSMTHRSHDLVAHRLGGAPLPRLLTGGLGCYGIYETADARHLTVGALEPVFVPTYVGSLGGPDLTETQYAADQEPLRSNLAAIFLSRPLAEWLARFEQEDVCVGTVATLAEASAAFAEPDRRATSLIGADTAAWRQELGV